MDRYFVRAPLRVEKLLCGKFDGDAGGVVTFVGSPRSRSHGKRILALEYEAYETMAQSRLSDLILEAQMRWPLTGVLLRHRLGRVPVGQASIVLQVSAAHRAEAFQACQFLIDVLKREVPIWKKEIYDNGQDAWVHCEHGEEPGAKLEHSR